MNQEQAKAWLPLIQAVAEGKTLQTKVTDCMSENLNQVWVECNNFLLALIESGANIKDVRIKPEPKKEWIRVGLWTAENSMPRCYANNIVPESQFERRKYFGGWLTDRIEYELPEGEA